MTTRTNELRDASMDQQDLRRQSAKVTAENRGNEPMLPSEVFIVDDDYDMREALCAILRDAGYRTAAFTDGRSFVRIARDQAPACVLLDICMPGLSGLEVLTELDAKNYPAPILIISAQDDVLNVVQAMRNGAYDYIEKQLDGDAIVARVVDAIETWTHLRRREEASPALSPAIQGYYQLTRREREVLSQIAGAASNKETARTLGISPRTVEIHRGRIMHKLGAKNSVDLMRIVMNTGRGA
jgi:two-component system, LuxR family, response regulator FixJ